MTDDLKQRIAQARAAYEALSPAERAWHDHEQRRSWVRGMCPSDRDYEEWCRQVDQQIPPLPKPERTAPEPIEFEIHTKDQRLIAHLHCECEKEISDLKMFGQNWFIHKMSLDMNGNATVSFRSIVYSQCRF